MDNNKRTIWLIAGLVSGYIMLQLVADVTAAKIIEVWGLTMPAGTFIFALTFTWRDMLHKRLGKEWARAAIVMAALCNLAMVVYFLFYRIHIRTTRYNCQYFSGWVTMMMPVFQWQCIFLIKCQPGLEIRIMISMGFI